MQKMTKQERRSVIVAGVATLAVVGIVSALIAAGMNRQKPLFNDPPKNAERGR